MTEPLVNLDNPFGLPEFQEGEDAFERALLSIMGTPEGRQVVWGVIAQTKIYDEVFSGNSTDIFEKGKRSVGLWLIAQLTEIDPTVYPRMLLDVARQEQIANKQAKEKEQDK